MSIYQRILGRPAVYDTIRPWVVGGIDMAPLFSRLECTAEDVVIDVGCGTGIALEHLRFFRRYHGFDVDASALAVARTRAASHGHVFFHACAPTREDFARVRPTRVILAGLLHHLDDGEAMALLELCAGTPTVRRVVTTDVVYVPRQPLSNLLAWLDRGRYVRQRSGYEELARRAGLRTVRADVIRSHPETGRALYLQMVLEPGA